MPDHLHWLMQLPEGGCLEDAMRGLKAHSGRRVNQVRGTPGEPVWQEGFHDRALRQEEDLRRAARYLVANPLRAGLVSDLGDYPLWDAVWVGGDPSNELIPT
jgi:REP element-mobilizing transposase RayT